MSQGEVFMSDKIQYFLSENSPGLTEAQKEEQQSRGYGVVHRYATHYCSGEDPAGCEEDTYRAVCGFESVSWSTPDMGAFLILYSMPEDVPRCRDCFPE